MIQQDIFLIHFPKVEYVIKVFHDENNNRNLGTGFFGIPTEAFGFSNNVSGFLPTKMQSFMLQQVTNQFIFKCNNMS